METIELKQTHPDQGSREFKLDNEEIHYVINSPLRNDELSVALNVLDANPVIEGPIMAFVSQVNREPLVELFIDSPDKNTFDQFVATLQERITEEDFSRFQVSDKGVNVALDRLDESISMLKRYVDPTEIDSLLSALFALRDNPTDIPCQRAVADAFNELGFVQGQVLNYAPYLNYLLTGNSDQSSNFLG